MAGLVAGLALAAPAAAACRLAMTIGMDVSASIDEREHALQREGLASALVAAEVVGAFLGDPSPVTLQVFEWSGRARQTVVSDWRVIAGAEDLAAVAGRLRAAPRADREFPTALGAALVFAAAQLGRVECDGAMINIAGDGENNDGIQPRVAIGEFGFERVTVNGLVVGGNVERLRRYYAEHVIHGPGSFVEVALRFEDFAEAMRRKLLRELAPVSALRP